MSRKLMRMFGSSIEESRVLKGKTGMIQEAVGIAGRSPALYDAVKYGRVDWWKRI